MVFKPILQMLMAGAVPPVPAAVAARRTFQSEQKAVVAKYHHQAVVRRAETAGQRIGVCLRCR